MHLITSASIQLVIINYKLKQCNSNIFSLVNSAGGND